MGSGEGWTPTWAKGVTIMSSPCLWGDGTSGREAKETSRAFPAFSFCPDYALRGARLAFTAPSGALLVPGLPSLNSSLEHTTVPLTNHSLYPYLSNEETVSQEQQGS